MGLVNPSVSVTVFGTEETVIDPLYFEFDITKDLDEEENTAELVIHNLGPNQLAMINAAENQGAPIEISATPAGGTDLALMYRGEIDNVRTEFLNPGHATTLSCTSQRANQRHFYFEETFASGTPKNAIVDAMIDAIGLPVGVIGELPTDGIILSETFSGPAFELLKSYVFDWGFRPYVTDGIISITSIYQPVDFTVYQIIADRLRGVPMRTARNDNAFIEMRVVVESEGGDPFTRPRKTKTAKVFGASDYVEYEAVDKLIQGVEFPISLQPTLNPDMIFKLPDSVGFENQYFRIQAINHRGENETFEEWETFVEGDLYDDINGDILDI